MCVCWVIYRAFQGKVPGVMRHASCVMRHASCVMRHASCVMLGIVADLAMGVPRMGGQRRDMGTREFTFDFERLDVYQRAVEVVVLVDRFAPLFTGPRRHLGWQLHRAATSIPLNIAEASGRFRKLDKAHFYVMATGSAMECAAILDIADRLDIGEASARSQLRQTLEHTTAMLIRLSQSVRNA
jgi:four helix bundle protein